MQLQGTGVKDCHFNQDHVIRLAGAHGEEVVRSIYADPASETVYTAGEDGRVAAFRPAQQDGQAVPKAKHVKKESKTPAENNRYRPY